MKESKEIAKDYYDFLMRYRNFIDNNAELFKSHLSPKDLEIEKALLIIHREEYRPWELLPEGKEVEKLEEILCSESKDRVKFVALCDKLLEQFNILSMAELREYYDKNKIRKSYENFINDIEEHRFSDSLDKNIFSDKTIELHKLYNESVTLSDRIIHFRRERNHQKTLEESEKFLNRVKVENLAKKYHQFIKHYESYLKKNQNTKIKDSLKQEHKIVNELMIIFEEEYEKTYCPWRTLPKNRIEKSLADIFENNYSETIRFIGALGYITDDFIFPAVEELEKYNQKNGINIDDEKLFDMVYGFKSKEDLNKNIFSKHTIDFFDVFKEADALENELDEYRKSLSISKENELEEDIEKEEI